MDDYSNNFCICFDMRINTKIILYHLLGRKTGKWSKSQQHDFGERMLSLSADSVLKKKRRQSFLPASSVTIIKKCRHFWPLVKKILQKKIQKKLSRLESARSTRVELDGIKEEEEVFLQPKRVKFANNHKSTRHKKVKPDKS